MGQYTEAPFPRHRITRTHRGGQASCRPRPDRASEWFTRGRDACFARAMCAVDRILGYRAKCGRAVAAFLASGDRRCHSDHVMLGPMAAIDTVARAATIALLALIALVMLRERPRALVSGATAALCGAVVSHLAISSPYYVLGGPLDPFLRGAALAAPAVFWVFTQAFFGDDRGLTRWHAAALLALIAVGFGRPAPVAQGLYYAGSLTMVGLALTQVVRELRDDLVESRRSMRPVFAAVVGLEMLSVLAVELWLGGAPASREIEALKSVAALGLALMFGAWLLTPRQDVFAVAPKPVPTAEATGELDVDARFREQLLTVAQGEQLFRQEGLTISALALKLDIPEYRVRRIINQQLGYRNFNAFLNDLRIGEACRLLADPAHERQPIFNLALDLGYGSLGPFNRAFRAKTGQTPTEYRRTHLESRTSAGESPAES